eukprot:3974840-Ditylum_brightwellii.AAC.1
MLDKLLDDFNGEAASLVATHLFTTHYVKSPDENDFKNLCQTMQYLQIMTEPPKPGSQWTRKLEIKGQCNIHCTADF